MRVAEGHRQTGSFLRHGCVVDAKAVEVMGHLSRSDRPSTCSQKCCSPARRQSNGSAAASCGYAKPRNRCVGTRRRLVKVNAVLRPDPSGRTCLHFRSQNHHEPEDPTIPFPVRCASFTTRPKSKFPSMRGCMIDLPSVSPVPRRRTQVTIRGTYRAPDDPLASRVIAVNRQLVAARFERRRAGAYLHRHRRPTCWYLSRFAQNESNFNNLLGVSKIHLTGNRETARNLLATAAENIVPHCPEFGGKSPLLVFSDADLIVAAQQSMSAMVGLAGKVVRCRRGSWWKRKPTIDNRLC
jgi:hypothetical protein